MASFFISIYSDRMQIESVKISSLISDPSNAHSAILGACSNTIYRGDNLEIMQAMPDECVDLVYIDPPFFTEAEYKNLWGDKESIQNFKAGTIFSDKTSFFENSVKFQAKGLNAYLLWMRQRLVEIHRLLKPSGFLFLHIDYHAIHYLKVMLDDLFGYDNFRNEIIWKRVNNAKAHGKRTLGPIHDTILFYGKSSRAVIREKPTGEYSESTIKGYNKDDGDGRGLYTTVPLVAAGQQQNRPFKWNGVVARWLYSKENLDKLLKDNRIYKTSSGGYRKKNYLSEARGRELGTLWIDDVVAPLQGSAQENTGYPTQKPTALLERILKIGSSEGEFVLDAFAGCGTTMHAAHNLKRKWVGIDVSPTAIKVNQKRLVELGAKVNIVDEDDLVDMRRAG